MKKKRLPIGLSDFKKLIEDNLYFVDKSLFIKDVVDGSQILLYPRPRRFGKTLNLSMLKYFYSNKEDYSHLFKSLNIENETDIMKKQGKYPIIYTTFKKETIEKAMENAKNQIIEKKYDIELKEMGIENIVKIAIVFDGKGVTVECF